MSFASKLVHMLDPVKPVYDSLVAAVYFFRPPVTGSAEYRLQTLLDFYGFLDVEYARVSASGQLQPVFAKFRSTFRRGAQFSTTKVLDFLLWTCVRMLRGGAQR